jgi:hypothetical protein
MMSRFQEMKENHERAKAFKAARTAAAAYGGL